MHRRIVLKGIASASGLALAPSAWAQGAGRPGRWLRLESPNFVVYSTASERHSREEVAALEGFHAVLMRLMPRSTAGGPKLPIYMTENERDFLATRPSMKGTNIAGFYSPSLEEVYAVSSKHKNEARQRDMPRNIRADDSRTTLFHEYAHHFIFSNNRAPYPSWYHEGFAEFLSTLEFRGGNAEIGKFTPNRAYWLQRGDWLDIETMLTHQPYELTGSQSVQFYAQAWLLTHMLFVRKDRAAGFDAYIRAIQDGGDPIGSFEPAFGLTTKQFEKELQDYKRGSIQFWRMEGARPISDGVTVRRLHASADELLLPAVFLRTMPDRESAAETVAYVRAEAKRHPDQPFAMSVGALAEVWYGDPAEARRQIDALLALQPDADAEHLSGLCDLRAAYRSEDEALFKRARSAFGRAYNLDNKRVPSMFRYVECGLAIEGRMDEPMLDVLVAACNLSPQVSILAITTASGLMANDRFSEAQFVLRPIASNPHGGELAKLAGRMLEDATAEEGSTFYFVGGLHGFDD